MTPLEREPRKDLLQRAWRLELFSVGWGVVSSTWSFAAGIRSHSLGVVALGLVVVADLIGSLAVLWRLRSEHRDASASVFAETRASLILITVLGVIATVITLSAVTQLIAGSVPGHSIDAVASACAAVVVLTPLGIAKYRLGNALASASLRGDGTLSVVGALLGLVALAGLGLEALWHWWWADRVAALVAAVVLFAEAFRVARHRT